MAGNQDYSADYDFSSDSNSRYSPITADSITFTNLPRNESAYGLKTFDADFFGDIAEADAITWNIKVTADENRSDAYGFGMSNNEGDVQTHATNNWPLIAGFMNKTGGGSRTSGIVSYDSGGFLDADLIAYTLNTLHYKKFYKNGATATLKIFDDPAMGAGDLLATLVINSPTNAMKNSYAANNLNTGQTSKMSGVINDLDIPQDVTGQGVLMGGGLGDDETLMGGMRL